MGTDYLIYVVSAVVALPLIGNVLAMTLGVLVTTRRPKGASDSAARRRAIEYRLHVAAAALGSRLENDPGVEAAGPAALRAEPVPARRRAAGRELLAR